MCIDLRVDMRVDMRADIRLTTCIEVWIDMPWRLDIIVHNTHGYGHGGGGGEEVFF